MLAKELVAKLREHRSFHEHERMLAAYFAEYFERLDLSDYEQVEPFDFRSDHLCRFIFDACVMLAESDEPWLEPHRMRLPDDIPKLHLPEAYEPSSLAATFYIGTIFHDAADIDAEHVRTLFDAESIMLQQRLLQFLRTIFIDGGMGDIMRENRGCSGRYCGTKILAYRMAGNVVVTFNRMSRPDEEYFLTVLVEDTPHPTSVNVQATNASLKQSLMMIDDVMRGWSKKTFVPNSDVAII